MKEWSIGSEVIGYKGAPAVAVAAAAAAAAAAAGEDFYSLTEIRRSIH